MDRVKLPFTLKRKKLIFLSLTILALPFLLMIKRIHHPTWFQAKTVIKPMILEAILINSKKNRSLSVFDSDAMENLLHMEALVATLVKYGNTGSYEPYLAESWEVNDKKTIYKFNLTTELTDELNTPITAEKYKNSLLNLL